MQLVFITFKTHLKNDKTLLLASSIHQWLGLGVWLCLGTSSLCCTGTQTQGTVYPWVLLTTQTAEVISPLFQHEILGHTLETSQIVMTLSLLAYFNWETLVCWLWPLGAIMENRDFKKFSFFCTKLTGCWQVLAKRLIPNRQQPKMQHTNHSIHVSVVSTLDEEGYKAHHIMHVTSHQSEESLKSYRAKCPQKKRKQGVLTLLTTKFHAQAQDQCLISSNLQWNWHLPLQCLLQQPF